MGLFLYLALGGVFGFLLSQARVTEYNTMIGLFRLTDFHVAGVMAVAIATAAIGLRILRRLTGTALTGEPIEMKPKPSHRWIFPSGLLFGAGWALTGACPGTALAQLGEGKLFALWTIAGILAGTYLYGACQPRTTPGR